MSARSTSGLSWAAAGTGLALLGMTTWFLGPLVSVRGMRPLESPLARGAAVAVLLAVLAAMAWRRLRRTDLGDVDPQAWAIERVVAQAALRLATPAGPAPGIFQHLRNLFAGPPPQALLYQRPWVLAIGTPGCDKARALAAAGLAPPAGTPDAEVLGWKIGPTGVLFDAGDAPCRGGDTWATLLAQLRRVRPLRPLNAVLVCVSAGELVGPAAAAEAPALAARLAELAKAIDPWLPVALVVTHCERIDGFPGDAPRRRLDEAVRAFDLGIAPKAVTYAGDDETVLRRFVEDEVFAVARATPVDAAAVKRLRQRMVLAYLALPVAFAAVAYTLAGSRQSNRDLVVDVAQRVPQAAAELDGLRSRWRGDPTPDPDLYRRLDALLKDNVLLSASPRTFNLGLDQRPKLSTAIEAHYHRQLGAILGAQLRSRIESELRAADPTVPARWYLLLRAYLELDLAERDAGPAGEREARAQAIAPVLLEILRKPIANAEPDLLQSMARHIEACLAHCTFAPREVDAALVARATAALANLSLEARMQAQLESAVDWSLVGETGAFSLATLSRQSPLLADGAATSSAVPAVFTASGSTRFAQRLATDIQLDTVRRSNATVGLDTAPDIDLDALRQRVLRRHAEARVRAWDGYLASLRIVRPSDPTALRTGLEQLASTDSPLINLLNVVSGETAPLGGLSATVLQWPEARIVSDHFAPLRQALAGSPSPAAAALARWPSLAADLEAQAASLPEPLRSLQVQLVRASGAGVASPANTTPEQALSPAKLVGIAALEAGNDAELASAAVVLGAVGDSWFSFGALNPTATSTLLSELRLPDATVIVNASSPAPRPDGAFDASAAQRLFRSRRWDAVLASVGLWRVVAALADTKQPLLATSNTGATASLSPTGLRLLEQQVRSDVRALVQARDASPSKGVPIVLHTYDHPTPRPAGAGPGQGPWLQPAMAAAGVPTTDQPALARALIDELARILAAIAQDSKQYPGLVLVDTRGTLAPAASDAAYESGDWLTELSPTRAGYAKLAQRWRSSAGFRVATGATTASDRRVPAAQTQNAADAAKKALVRDLKKAR